MRFGFSALTFVGGWLVKFEGGVVDEVSQFEGGVGFEVFQLSLSSFVGGW